MGIDRSILGLTRDQIEARLGPPDDVGGVSRKHPKPKIWLYGSTEINFSPKTHLVWMLFDDPEKGGTGITTIKI